MKKLILLIIFQISIQYSFCQKTFDTESNMKTNIYFHSLEKYFESIEKNKPENNKYYYIGERPVYLDSFPKTINGFNIKWVEKVDLNKILESNKTDFINLSISTIRIEKDNFSVSIVPFYAHFKTKKYTVLDGVFKFQYKFDPKLNGLVFEKLIIDN